MPNKLSKDEMANWEQHVLDLRTRGRLRAAILYLVDVKYTLQVAAANPNPLEESKVIDLLNALESTERAISIADNIGQYIQDSLNIQLVSKLESIMDAARRVDKDQRVEVETQRINHALNDAWREINRRVSEHMPQQLVAAESLLKPFNKSAYQTDDYKTYSSEIQRVRKRGTELSQKAQQASAIQNWTLAKQYFSELAEFGQQYGVQHWVIEGRFGERQAKTFEELTAELEKRSASAPTYDNLESQLRASRKAQHEGYQVLEKAIREFGNWIVAASSQDAIYELAVRIYKEYEDTFLAKILCEGLEKKGYDGTGFRTLYDNIAEIESLKDGIYEQMSTEAPEIIIHQIVNMKNNNMKSPALDNLLIQARFEALRIAIRNNNRSAIEEQNNALQGERRGDTWFTEKQEFLLTAADEIATIYVKLIEAERATQSAQIEDIRRANNLLRDIEALLIPKLPPVDEMSIYDPIIERYNTIARDQQIQSDRYSELENLLQAAKAEEQNGSIYYAYDEYRWILHKYPDSEVAHAEVNRIEVQLELVDIQTEQLKESLETGENLNANLRELEIYQGDTHIRSLLAEGYKRLFDDAIQKSDLTTAQDAVINYNKVVPDDVSLQNHYELATQLIDAVENARATLTRLAETELEQVNVDEYDKLISSLKATATKVNTLTPSAIDSLQEEIDKAEKERNQIADYQRLANEFWDYVANRRLSNAEKVAEEIRSRFKQPVFREKFNLLKDLIQGSDEKLRQAQADYNDVEQSTAAEVVTTLTKLRQKLAPHMEDSAIHPEVIALLQHTDLMAQNLLERADGIAKAEELISRDKQYENALHILEALENRLGNDPIITIYRKRYQDEVLAQKQSEAQSLIDDARRILLNAQQHDDRRDYEQALTRLKEAQQFFPSDELKSEIAHLGQFLRKYDTIQVHANQGKSLSMSDSLARSFESYQKAVEAASQLKIRDELKSLITEVLAFPENQWQDLKVFEEFKQHVHDIIFDLNSHDYQELYAQSLIGAFIRVRSRFAQEGVARTFAMFAESSTTQESQFSNWKKSYEGAKAFHDQDPNAPNANQELFAFRTKILKWVEEKGEQSLSRTQGYLKSYDYENAVAETNYLNALYLSLRDDIPYIAPLLFTDDSGENHQDNLEYKAQAERLRDIQTDTETLVTQITDGLNALTEPYDDFLDLLHLWDTFEQKQGTDLKNIANELVLLYQRKWDIRCRYIIRQARALISHKRIDIADETNNNTELSIIEYLGRMRDLLADENFEIENANQFRNNTLDNYRLELARLYDELVNWIEAERLFNKAERHKNDQEFGLALQKYKEAEAVYPLQKIKDAITSLNRQLEVEDEYRDLFNQAEDARLISNYDEAYKYYGLAASKLGDRSEEGKRTKSLEHLMQSVKLILRAKDEIANGNYPLAKRLLAQTRQGLGRFADLNISFEVQLVEEDLSSLELSVDHIRHLTEMMNQRRYEQVIKEYEAKISPELQENPDIRNLYLQAQAYVQKAATIRQWLDEIQQILGDRTLASAEEAKKQALAIRNELDELVGNPLYELKSEADRLIFKATAIAATIEHERETARQTAETLREAEKQASQGDFNGALQTLESIPFDNANRINLQNQIKQRRQEVEQWEKQFQSKRIGVVIDTLKETITALNKLLQDAPFEHQRNQVDREIVILKQQQDILAQMETNTDDILQEIYDLHAIMNISEEPNGITRQAQNQIREQINRTLRSQERDFLYHIQEVEGHVVENDVETTETEFKEVEKIIQKTLQFKPYMDNAQLRTVQEWDERYSSQRIIFYLRVGRDYLENGAFANAKAILDKLHNFDLSEPAQRQYDKLLKDIEEIEGQKVTVQKWFENLAQAFRLMDKEQVSQVLQDIDRSLLSDSDKPLLVRYEEIHRLWNDAEFANSARESWSKYTQIVGKATDLPFVENFEILQEEAKEALLDELYHQVIDILKDTTQDIQLAQEIVDSPEIKASRHKNTLSRLVQNEANTRKVIQLLSQYEPRADDVDDALELLKDLSSENTSRSMEGWLSLARAWQVLQSGNSPSSNDLESIKKHLTDVNLDGFYRMVEKQQRLSNELEALRQEQSNLFSGGLPENIEDHISSIHTLVEQMASLIEKFEVLQYQHAVYDQLTATVAQRIVALSTMATNHNRHYEALLYATEARLLSNKVRRLEPDNLQEIQNRFTAAETTWKIEDEYQQNQATMSKGWELQQSGVFVESRKQFTALLQQGVALREAERWAEYTRQMDLGLEQMVNMAWDAAETYFEAASRALDIPPLEDKWFKDAFKNITYARAVVTLWLENVQVTKDAQKANDESLENVDKAKRDEIRKLLKQAQTVVDAAQVAHESSRMSTTPRSDQ